MKRLSLPRGLRRLFLLGAVPVLAIAVLPVEEAIAQQPGAPASAAQPEAATSETRTVSCSGRPAFTAPVAPRLTAAAPDTMTERRSSFILSLQGRLANRSTAPG